MAPYYIKYFVFFIISCPWRCSLIVLVLSYFPIAKFISSSFFVLPSFNIFNTVLASTYYKFVVNDICILTLSSCVYHMITSGLDCIYSKRPYKWLRNFLFVVNVSFLNYYSPYDNNVFIYICLHTYFIKYRWNSGIQYTCVIVVVLSSSTYNRVFLSYFSFKYFFCICSPSFNSRGVLMSTFLFYYC